MPKKGRPKKKKVEETVDISVETTSNDVDSKEEINIRAPFEYSSPETKEDYLALYKLLKDLAINSIGDLEVKISRM